MAEHRFFKQGDTSIGIATAGSSGGGDASVNDVIRAVQGLARTFAKGIEDLKANRPDNVTVRFSLGVSAAGKVMVTLGEEGRNFEVALSWTQSHAAMPSLPDMSDGSP